MPRGWGFKVAAVLLGAAVGGIIWTVQFVVRKGYFPWP